MQCGTVWNETLGSSVDETLALMQCGMALVWNEKWALIVEWTERLLVWNGTCGSNVEWNIRLQCGMKNVAYCGMEHGTLGSAEVQNVTQVSMMVKYVDQEDLLQNGTLHGLNITCNVERKSLLCGMERQVLVWNGTLVLIQ